MEILSLPRGISLRPSNFNAEDTRLAYNLASAATPLSTQKEWPLRQSRFQVGSGERLNNFFRQLIGYGPSAYWVVEDGQRFVSTLNVHPGSFGQNHRIKLVVHPDWRGTLEQALISRALHYLYLWRKKAVTLKHPIDHVEAIETYKEFGFQQDRVLLWMKWKV